MSEGFITTLFIYVPFHYGIVKSFYSRMKQLIALDIAKSDNTLTNYNELVAAISEVNTKLMDAATIALASQEKQSALSNRITELENQLRKIEDWESKIQRYELYTFPSGTFAYSLKKEVEPIEPPHYLYATCVNERKPTILQPIGRGLDCPVCKTTIVIHNI